MLASAIDSWYPISFKNRQYWKAGNAICHRNGKLHFKYKVVEEFWIQFRWAICFSKTCTWFFRSLDPVLCRCSPSRLLWASGVSRIISPRALFLRAQQLWARPAPHHWSMGQGQLGHIAQKYCFQLAEDGRSPNPGESFFECFQRLHNSQHRCTNDSSIWSAGSSTDDALSSVQYAVFGQHWCPQHMDDVPV